ncbi:hypothetical protein NBRC116188_00850 [Oceaniserpentilla sp. 4NH20-0058]|uniref:hypothetical protein n=1 Tax=Oceaniserpentilla sp. 4NH20-0058 TaxID=3127660 RepID=UPI0031093792
MIPNDINIDDLYGPIKEGRTPNCYVDDQIFWNHSKTHFVIIYTIYEASMGNNIGHIAWGTKSDQGHRVIENPKDMRVSCWGSPFCKWLDEITFIFKVQKYNKTNNRIYTSLVAINLDQGFHVIENTNDTVSRVSEYELPISSYRYYDFEKLVDSIFSQNTVDLPPVKQTINKNRINESSYTFRFLSFIYPILKKINPTKKQEKKASELINKAGYILIFVVVILAAINITSKGSG